LRALPVDDDGRRRDRDQRGDRRQPEARQPRLREVGAGGALAQRLGRPDDELRERRHEDDDQESGRQRGRQPGGGSVQPPRDDRLAARERAVVARAAAQHPLQQHERDGQRDQHGGELQRRRAVERAVPDAVDRVGHRAVVEEVDRAEVGQRLHHRQRRPGGQRRPGEREREPADRPRVAQPEAARGLERVARLLQERRAAEHVDVRVQHEREHHDRSAGGPDLRQLDAECVADRPLQPTVGVVLAEQHEHEHVGRHRQRQHERPVEPAPAGEVVERDERSQRAAEHQGAGADA
jgi:hypothetical protein